MSPFAIPRRAAPLFALLCGASLLVGARAEAQVNPLWDHYTLYYTGGGQPLGTPVSLIDQFGPYDHQVDELGLFMNPAEKLVQGQPAPSPINNPLLHYSWWHITPQPFSAIVTAVNQFGDQTITVQDAHYLLNPAIKNQTGQPPVANHYKCYLCDGPPVNLQVQLTDQFGPFVATVTSPSFFCNPAEKRVDPPNGAVYPIQDPNQHYICYEFVPEHQTFATASVTDQFVTNQPIQLVASRTLCVPTYKTGVTETSKNTWGKLKQLYR